jgi:hypothetical protein
METQAKQLHDFLIEEGWELIQKRVTDLPWWIDEMWKLKSNWSPQDAVIWVAFQVDPMNFSYSRSKGKYVWCVSFHRTDPILDDSQKIMSITISPKWEKKFSASKTELRAMRNNLSNI